MTTGEPFLSGISSRKRNSVSFEVERLSCHIETEDQQLNDLRTLTRRSDSRIVALREQLGRSQNNLATTSARFNQLAEAIPADIADLNVRLSTIINAASVEADQIRGEARRFAETLRVEAESQAAGIITEAQLEHQHAAELRADLQAQTKQIRSDIAQLREQATRNASEILREAEDEAAEVLARVHRDVDAQIKLAQTKLDELSQARANIVGQLREFYDSFTTLGEPVEPSSSAALDLMLPPSTSPRTRHSARELLGDVG